MKTPKLSTALALLALTTQAQAELNLNSSFTPAANPAYMFTEDAISSSIWNPLGAQPKGRIFFSAYYHMVNDPLVELDSDRKERLDTLIDSMNSLDLTFGYSIIEKLQLGASLSMSMVGLPNVASQFGLGDARLFGKLRLNDHREPVAFALMPELGLPTGDTSLFLSSGSVSAGLRFIAEHDFGIVSVSGNAGYRHRANAEFRDLNMKNALPLSLGALVPIGPRWAINGDIGGEMILPLNRYVNPSNVYVGARYRLPSDLIVSFGAAAGSVNGYSSADYRVIAGLTLMPQGKPEPEPVVAPQKPAEPAPVVSAVAKPAEPPRVVFTPKEILISEEVKFEHAKAILTAGGKNLLDEVAAVMKENKEHYKLVVVEGHTNELGTFPYNQKLSEQRASAVRDYLVSKGIAAKTLLTVGYGKTKPKRIQKASAETKLAENRRVAFKVVQ